MGDNAYEMGQLKLTERIKACLNGFGSSLVNGTNGPFFSGIKMGPKDRKQSEEFFKDKENNPFIPGFIQSMITGQDGDVILKQQELHMIASMEQDHHVRYSCSRRHALTTSANNMLRIAKDLDLIYNFKRRHQP